MGSFTANLLRNTVIIEGKNARFCHFWWNANWSLQLKQRLN